MKIAAAYIRVSTDDQTEYSPESQIRIIRDYAKRNDMIIPEEYIFIDEGISGKSTKKRPAFNKMIGIAKTRPKPFEAILLWKFSRFARNREDSIVYKSMLRKQLGIDVISVSENLGDDKMSVLIEALIEAMDEYYSINLAEEVKRGMTEKASRGEPLTIAPFGYNIINKNLIVNENEMPIIKMIFNDFINGAGYRELATKINSMGIRTRRNNLFESRNIEYIVNNPVYIGKIRWNPTGKTKRNYKSEDLMIVTGNHTPIITQEQWDATQERISEIKKMYKRYDRSVTFSNIFQGLIKCSNCGATLTKCSGKNGLQCQQYAKGRCTVSHYITMQKAESIIFELMKKDLAGGKIQIIQKTPTSNEHNDFINMQIKKEKVKLQRVKEAYANGIDTLEEYKENKKRINNEIKSLEKQIMKLKPYSQAELEKKFREKNRNTVEIINDPNISIQDKNKMLRSFIDQIIYDKPLNELRLFYYV